MSRDRPARPRPFVGFEHARHRAHDLVRASSGTMCPTRSSRSTVMVSALSSQPWSRGDWRWDRRGRRGDGWARADTAAGEGVGGLCRPESPRRPAVATLATSPLTPLVRSERADSRHAMIAPPWPTSLAGTGGRCPTRGRPGSAPVSEDRPKPGPATPVVADEPDLVGLEGVEQLESAQPWLVRSPSHGYADGHAVGERPHDAASTPSSSTCRGHDGPCSPGPGVSWRW